MDYKILLELQRDGRASIAGIAENIRSSRPTVTNRLKRLIDDKLVIVRGILNVKEFGFKMACVGLEVKSDESRREVERRLKDCPRVLSIFRTPYKANVHLAVWGEDDQTMNSTVQSFRDIPNVDLVYTHYLGAPIHGDLAINIQPAMLKDAPCGNICSDCSRYANGWCVGCPVTVYYKNPIKE